MSTLIPLLSMPWRYDDLSDRRFRLRERARIGPLGAISEPESGTDGFSAGTSIVCSPAGGDIVGVARGNVGFLIIKAGSVMTGTPLSAEAKEACCDSED